MTRSRPTTVRTLMAMMLALLVLLSTTLTAMAQSPSPSPDPSAGATATSPAAPTLGGVLADEEGRDPSAAPVLSLGTALDGLAVSGPRDAFAPGEAAAFRLELPDAVDQIALTVQLAGSVDGVDALWSYPSIPVDPSWDTVAGTLGVPPVGDYLVRLFAGGELLAETPLAVRDVPRLLSLLTDPLGLVSAEAERVAAAGQRFEDATGGGWLWIVLIDTTGGLRVADWTADLWAVNADQIDPRDALLVAAVGDVDLSILVGADAALTIVPEELTAIEEEAIFALSDGRLGDMIDDVADGLVLAHQEGPVASPSPTPEPTPEPTPDTVRVPDLTGLSRAEAELLAARRGLETRVTFRRTNEAEPGTVISQSPAAGRTVASGATVTLVVASRPQTVAVPDLAGLTENDAISVLLDEGLEPGERTGRFNQQIPTGRIIRSDPAAGTQVEPGSVVDYIVSRGPQATGTPPPTPGPVEVPQVRGETEDDAITILLEADLELGTRFRRNNQDIPAGRVIRTEPAAGTVVARGTSVDYFVSLGAPTPEPTAGPVEVPDLRGEREDDAITILLEADLEVGSRFRRTNDNVGAGRVIRTDPAAGTSVAPGTSIDYFLSTGPEPTAQPTTAPATPRPTRSPRPTPTPTAGPVAVPDVRGEREDDGLAILLEENLEVGTRFRRSNSNVPAGRIIRTDPAAGTLVVPGTRIDYYLSTGPAPTTAPSTPQPTPTPTPRPTRSPRPTPSPRPTAAPVEVPDLRGEREDDGLAILLDAGLEAGTRIERNNQTVPEGRIIRTDPAAGTIVEPGTSVDYYVSRGAPDPEPTAEPTAEPSPEPSAPAGDDRLARILDAGVIRVNVAEADGDWSFQRPNGNRAGFDAWLARSIADRLGVTVELTTFPLEEVRAGPWEDRFDVAISRLAIVDGDPAVLEFSGPYAFDPQQLAVTTESGLTSIEELADRSICTAQGDTGMAWLEGTLALVDAPLDPATPPDGATAVAGPTDADCQALIGAGGAPFDAWLASLPTVATAIADGAPIGAVGNPVVWAPVGVAFDAASGDNGSLIEAIDVIIAELRDAGTTSTNSIRFFELDLTVVPEDGVPIFVAPAP